MVVVERVRRVDIHFAGLTTSYMWTRVNVSIATKKSGALDGLRPNPKSSQKPCPSTGARLRSRLCLGKKNSETKGRGRGFFRGACLGGGTTRAARARLASRGRLLSPHHGSLGFQNQFPAGTARQFFCSSLGSFAELLFLPCQGFFPPGCGPRGKIKI